MKTYKKLLLLGSICLAICSYSKASEEEEFSNAGEFEEEEPTFSTQIQPYEVSVVDEQQIEKEFPWLKAIDANKSEQQLEDMYKRLVKESNNLPINKKIILYKMIINRNAIVGDKKIKAAAGTVVQDLINSIKKLEESVALPTQIGDKKYVLNDNIAPGQIRIANAGVNEKVKAALQAGFVMQAGGNYTDLKFNEGSSIISDQNALPIVLIKREGKTYGILLDGHHDFGANKKVGGSTVYVEVKDDLTNIPENAVWNELEAKGYIYPYNLSGEKIIPLPLSFDALQNDDYRFFVKLSMLECKSPETILKDAKAGTKNLKYPLAVKWKDKKFNPYIVTVENEKYTLNPAFIEFKVADQLYALGKQYGFDYKVGDENNAQKFQDEVERARALLKEHPVNGFNIILDKIDAQELNKGNPCAYTYTNSKKEEQPTEKIEQPAIAITPRRPHRGPVVHTPIDDLRAQAIATESEIVQSGPQPIHEYTHMQVTIINKTDNPIAVLFRFGGYKVAQTIVTDKVIVDINARRPAACGDLYIFNAVTGKWQLTEKYNTATGQFESGPTWLCGTATYSITRSQDGNFQMQ
ncbi:MAG: ParB-like protein [Candidatus Babeliales bacterium]